MSDQNRDFQNQNGGYPNYGQPQYYQAPPVPQGVEGQPVPQGGQMPYGQPMYYQAQPMQPGDPMQQGQPMYYQAPPAQQGQPMYYQAPPAQQGQPMYYQAPPVQQGQPMYYQAPPAQQGQPMYYQAPPAQQAAHVVPSEPEVILQTPTFEDYGFSANDSLDNGHDFGGFMSDSNSDSFLATEPGGNIFNSQTPNLDISDVEASASVKNEAESAMFSAPTPNLDINSVEAASKVSTEADKEIFSNPMPIIPVETSPAAAVSVDAEVQNIAPVAGAPLAETSVAEAPVIQTDTPPAETPVAPSINFMASMQSMFSSMTGSAAAVPAAPSVPVAEPTPAAPVAETPAFEVPTAQPEIPEAPAPAVMPVEEPATPVEYQQPDVVVTETNTDANTIQDISSTSAPDDKGPEYWAYMNQLLNKFDDGQVHVEVGNDLPFTPAAPREEAPIQTEIPVQEKAPVQEEVPVANLPITPVAPAPTYVDAPQTPKANIIRDVSNTTPEAAPIAGVAAAAIPLAAEAVSSDAPQAMDMPEDIDDKTLKKMEKARKAEEKAAAKAAKAAAKAEKAAAKAAKKNQALEDTADFDDDLDEEATQETSKAKRILGAVFPKKGDPKSEIIRKIVLIVAAVVFIGCMISLAITYMGTRENAQASEELSSMMATGEAAEADWSTIYNKYPDITFPVGMQTKFADLYALNEDLVGWIRIAGLDIDYPVVQAEDDSYYLKRDYKGNKSDYGTVFVGWQNNIETLDQNTVVYGHSMRRDTQMFTALKEYKSIEGFKNNPIIEFNTLYADYKFKVYAVFISNGSTAGDDGYVFQYTTPNLANIESFAGFVDQLNQRTLYYTGVDIQPDDKLITLSTCTYEFDNARLVVVGRLIRDGESEEVDVSKATVNSNPRYPQAWYDENNQTNPYQTYAKWAPTPAN